MFRLRVPNFSVWFFISLASIIILFLFVVYPLFSLLTASFTAPETGGFSLAGYREFFATEEYVDATINSLLLGFGTTIGALAIGVPMAFVVARYDFRFKNIIAMLPLVTFVLPDIIVCQSWILVFGNNGVVTNFMWDYFKIEMPTFYGWTGLFYVMILQHFGFVYLMTLAAFKGIDVTLEEAAHNLGSSPWRIYRTVTIPVLTPAILVSAMVVFTLAVDNFGVPIIVAQRIPILSVTAYNTFISELGNEPVMQSTMAMVLVAIVTTILVIQKGYIERRVYEMEAGRSPPVRPLTGLASKIVGGGLMFFISLSLLPVVIITVGAFTLSKGPVMHWGSFSLTSLKKLLIFASEALYNSFFLATIATVFGVIFSILVSYLLVKKRSGMTNVLDFMAMLPLAIAGTVLGIALVNTYNTGSVVLTGTWMIMATAYFVRRVPFSIRTASSVLFSIKNSIEEASINLGVPPGRTFLNVILPLMRPAVISAAILMWVTTLSELSATIVLYTAGLSTMPIQIFQAIDSGYMGPASAYSIVLIASIFVPIFIAIKVFKIDVFASR